MMQDRHSIDDASFTALTQLGLYVKPLQFKTGDDVLPSMCVAVGALCPSPCISMYAGARLICY